MALSAKVALEQERQNFQRTVVRQQQAGDGRLGIPATSTDYSLGTFCYSKRESES